MYCNSILTQNVVTRRGFDVNVGHLFPGNIPVFLQYYRDRDEFDRVWYFCSTYTHPSILRSFCGGGESWTEQYMIIFERFSQTLSAYRDLLNRSQGFAFTSFYDGPSLPMVTSGVRDLLRKLMECLKYIHKNNIALGGFNFDNIVVDDETPKLFNVNAQIKDDPNIAADFRSFAGIIQFLYEGRMIPGELVALKAELMKWAESLNWSEISNADLIYDHPSLWDEARRLTFLRNFEDWRSFVPYYMLRQYHDAISGINLPRNATSWKSLVPPQSAFMSCLKNKEYNETPEDLARFQRNCAGHIAKYSRNGKKFNQLTLEPRMQYLFPMHLVELVSRLYWGRFPTTFFTL